MAVSIPVATTPILPPVPPRLTIEHATQSQTAAAGTETLLRHAGAERAHHITAGACTGPANKILRKRGWALARARLGRRQLRRFPSHLLLDAVQRLFPACCSLLPLPRAITPRVLPTTLLARHAGSVRAATLPATPVPGTLAAGCATVTLLGIPRTERLLAPFEETAPLPMRRKWFLRPTVCGPILR